MKGIYGYYDLKNEYWVYIGKDSNIEYDKRHGHHKTPKMKNRQKINQVIQNNPERYKYYRLIEFKNDISDKELRCVENIYIKTLQTCKYDYPEKSCFNFEDVAIENQEGYWKDKNIPEETKQKISKTLKGRHTSPRTEFKKGHKLHLESQIKRSQTIGNKTGYFRVFKRYREDYAQGFTYVYGWTDDEGHHELSRVDLKKLEKLVKSKNLEWRKL